MDVTLRYEVRGRNTKTGRLFLVHQVSEGSIQLWIEKEREVRKFPFKKRKTHKEKVFIYKEHVKGDTACLMLYLSIVRGEIPPIALENLIISVVAKAKENNSRLLCLLDYWCADTSLVYGTLVMAR